MKSWDLEKMADRLAVPIPMILHCPNCGLQHIDRDETPSDREWSAQPAGDREQQYWTNPPHRSHLCHGCKHIWRPADVPTTGVREIATKGKNDSPASVSFFDRMSLVEEAFQLVAQGYNRDRLRYSTDHDYIVFLRDKLTDAFSRLQQVCRRGGWPWGQPAESPDDFHVLKRRAAMHNSSAYLTGWQDIRPDETKDMTPDQREKLTAMFRRTLAGPKRER